MFGGRNDHVKITALFCPGKTTPKGIIYSGNLCHVSKDPHSKLSLLFTTRKKIISPENLICFILPDNGNYMTLPVSLFALATRKLRAICYGPLQ